MTLIKNQYGTVDLQATVADMDKRLTKIEAEHEAEAAAKTEPAPAEPTEPTKAD